jgi:hypothetical protein
VKHLPDLRAFVAELDSIGEITHVGKEVDWNLEPGAVAADRMSCVPRHRCSRTSPGSRTAFAYSPRPAACPHSPASHTPAWRSPR